MVFKETPLEGAIVIEPKVFGDNRGHFFESYRETWMHDAGIKEHFVQDNQSLSAKGILRGLHFQKPPYSQGKMVRVIKGAAMDVVVDIRKASGTYGKHFSIELNEKNKTMFWIPPGFAHGFLTLEDDTIFCYKCTKIYNPESEGGLQWDDESLSIDWGIESPVISDKDKNYIPFTEFKSPF